MSLDTSDSARRDLPSGTPDPYIVAIAAREREVARIHSQWHRDHVRLDLGWVEVVDPEDGKGQARFLPCQRGCAPYAHGHFVRDVITPETEEALAALDQRIQVLATLHHDGRISTRMAVTGYRTALATATATIDRSQP
jgi:hypothetical protein